MKNINFKFITVLGVAAILLSLGACSSSGKSNVQESDIDLITKEDSHSVSINTSINDKILLAEECAEKFLNAVYNEDFDVFINLLDKLNYEAYMDSETEEQNEYREKFFLINQKLKESYTENWLNLLDFDDIDPIKASNNLYNIDTFIENNYIFELKLEEEDGKFVLQNGLDDLDDLSYIY